MAQLRLLSGPRAFQAEGRGVRRVSLLDANGAESCWGVNRSQRDWVGSHLGSLPLPSLARDSRPRIAGAARSGAGRAYGQICCVVKMVVVEVVPPQTADAGFPF